VVGTLAAQSRSTTARGTEAVAVAAPSRADSLLAVGRLRAAEDVLYAAVAAAPRRPAPRGALGRYLASRGRFPIAQVLFEEAQRFGADARVVARAIAELRPYRADSAVRGTATVPFAFAEDNRFIGFFRAGSADGRSVTVTLDPRLTGFVVRAAATAPTELRLGELRLPLRTPQEDATIPEGEIRAGLDLLWRNGFLFDERMGTLTIGWRAGRSGGVVTYVPVMLTFPGLSLVPRPGIPPIPLELEAARRLLRGRRWWLDAEQSALVVER
jgi:hypothetical protein